MHPTTALLHHLRGRADVQTIETTDDGYVVTVKCRECQGDTPITISSVSVVNWLIKGQLIQEALVDVEHEQRELLISGICSACFDALFKEEKE